MSTVRDLGEIDIDDLTYDELQNLNDPNNTSGILSCKQILFVDMDYDTLETLFQYDPIGNLEMLMKHRPDFIKQYHPEVLN